MYQDLRVLVRVESGSTHQHLEFCEESQGLQSPLFQPLKFMEGCGLVVGVIKDPFHVCQKSVPGGESLHIHDLFSTYVCPLSCKTFSSHLAQREQDLHLIILVLGSVSQEEH